MVMMSQAAEMGAVNALKSLGLGDESAQKDIIDLRSFIRSWGDVKSTALRSLTQFVVVALLTTLAIGFYLKGK